jgi:hypothetical protein
MSIFWASIPIGLAIVAAAVGIPYWLTHRGMRPNNPVEAQAYLDAKDEVAQTTDTDERQEAVRAATARRAAARSGRAGQPGDTQARSS